MTNNTDSGSAWPFPKSDASNEGAPSEREPVDPLEQKLADQSVRHDEKVTRDMDSELPDNSNSEHS